jgi:hypothetical protein
LGIPERQFNDLEILYRKILIRDIHGGQNQFKKCFKPKMNFETSENSDLVADYTTP